MKRRAIRPTALTPRLLSLVLVALLLGVFFRVINLDKKVYWHDEVYTSMEMTAQRRSEVVEQLFTGQIVTRDELQAFQRFRPERGLGELLTSLGQEDPQHPPLYYILGRFWVQMFGDSVVVLRSLAVVFGLLVLVCAYWLCMELFQAPAIALMTVGLLALSPYHVLYAQESREYSLWAALILASSALLLRALRLGTWPHWALYSLSIAAGLYTFLFTGLVGIAHGFYVLLNGGISHQWEKWRVTHAGIAYLGWSLVAIAAFAPWLYFLVKYRDVLSNTTGWARESLPLWVMAKASALNFSRILMDFDWNPDTFSLWWLTIPLLVLEGYALIFIRKNAPRHIWTFVWTLTIIPTLILALPDLVLGGQRSIVGRYLVPSFLGLHLAVGYLLTMKIEVFGAKNRKFWRAIALLLFFLGFLSNAFSSQAETWWNKGISYHIPAIARTLNEANQPIVISDDFGINVGNLIALSYRTNDSVRFYLLPHETEINLSPDQFPDNSEIFVFYLPEIERNQIQQSLGKPLNEVGWHLWKLEPEEPTTGAIAPRRASVLSMI
ncbi:MAG: glycosyltransferase family 39 protein [Cyanobacteriota bacterium]